MAPGRGGVAGGEPGLGCDLKVQKPTQQGRGQQQAGLWGRASPAGAVSVLQVERPPSPSAQQQQNEQEQKNESLPYKALNGIQGDYVYKVPSTYTL